MTPAGFACLAGLVKDVADHVCEGKLALSLEGGYDVQAVPACVEAVLWELSGASRCRPEEMVENAHRKKVEYALSRCRHVHGRFWKLLNERVQRS